MSSDQTQAQAQHWASLVAEQFKPTRYVLDDEMRRDIELGLGVENTFRQVLGKPLRTLEEALAERQAAIDSGEYARFITEELPQLIAEAEERVAAQEQALRAAPAVTFTGGTHG